MFDQNLEGIQYLAKIFNNFLFRKGTLFAYFGQHVTAVAIFQHQIVVMWSLF